MMLGFLLARAGVDVIVLEKHADFFRDFRGDTIHPSTLENIYELGLLDEFLKRPHQEMRQVQAQIGDREFPVADFSQLPTRCKFIAFMPQWDFLDFVAGQAKKRKTFRLLMETEAVDLIVENARVVGVRALQSGGEIEIKAMLTVAADGRHSVLREKSGLEVVDFGAPMDVLWLRISENEPSDAAESLGRALPGRLLIMIDRGDYWQIAFVIAKGAFEAVRARGLEAFRADLTSVVPNLSDRAGEIASWDDVKLLTVTVDRLKRWYRDGLLCIGDAAHAMSPIGGVGINLAVQDAVAAANILAGPLTKTRVRLSDLQAVQARRERPTRITQGVQVFIQKQIIAQVLTAKRSLPVPLPLRLLKWLPFLRRFPARFVGIGVRPEHVRTPDTHSTLEL